MNARRLLAATLAGALAPALAAQAARRPDDPLFPRQLSAWFEGGAAHHLLDAARGREAEVDVAPGIHLDLPRAWARTTGSRDVVVALLDDGFCYAHEDIAGNVWRNPGETGVDDRGLRKESNGRDDDGNGFADDVVGWDFAFDDPDPDHYVFDGMDRGRIQPYRHSIPALGIIGAVGDNGVGVAGINWHVSMMLLKIGAQGSGRDDPGHDRVARAAQAIRYAVDQGARVINWSGFVRPREPGDVTELAAAIAHAGDHGVLVVVGAGNDGVDLDRPEHRVYPQCFDHPNLLRVAQVGFDGEPYAYVTGGVRRGTDFGPGHVEIAALGEHLTTDLHHGESTYGGSNGTSNAGPVVAGVAALMLSIRPDLDAAALERILCETATPRESLRGVVACGGIVNAGRAVERAATW